MKWGILSTGGVANAFAEALRYVSDAELIAVGSRTIEKAGAFSAKHGGMFTREDGLVALPGVDAVYVASPASHHYPHAMMALKAGKHVLVEKPFTATAEQARILTDEAGMRGLLCMEAMWPRFLPSWAKLRELLTSGAIGEVRAVDASFGGRAEFNPRTRPFKLELCGGAIMDAAVYPVSFAQMIFPGLECRGAAGHIGESGVDEQVGILMGAGGRFATARAGLRTTFDARATVYGTEGMILVDGNFTNPSWIEVHRPDRPPEHYNFERSRHRLAWQVDELQRCAAAGLCESPVMSHGDSVGVMRVLDAARAEIGLVWPEEVEAT